MAKYFEQKKGGMSLALWKALVARKAKKKNVPVKITKKRKKK